MSPNRVVGVAPFAGHGTWRRQLPLTSRIPGAATDVVAFAAEIEARVESVVVPLTIRIINNSIAVWTDSLPGALSYVSY